jgi:hypothetical protein
LSCRKESVRAALVLLIAASLPASPQAQSVAPVAARRLDAERRADSVARRNDIPMRTLFGVGGAALGMIAGGFIGLKVPRSDCHCDDPGLAEFLEGITLGGVVGGTLAAAWPRLESNCSTPKRLGLGALGSLLGGVAGGVAAAHWAHDPGPAIAYYIAGVGLGAGVASGLCHHSG